MYFQRRFPSDQYHEAKTHARRYATRIGLPVELRKMEEFGVPVLVLSLIARHETTKGETVQPGEPHSYPPGFIGPWEHSAIAFDAERKAMSRDQHRAAIMEDLRAVPKGIPLAAGALLMEDVTDSLVRACRELGVRDTNKVHSEAMDALDIERGDAPLRIGKPAELPRRGTKRRGLGWGV